MKDGQTDGQTDGRTDYYYSHVPLCIKTYLEMITVMPRILLQRGICYCFLFQKKTTIQKFNFLQ